MGPIAKYTLILLSRTEKLSTLQLKALTKVSHISSLSRMLTNLKNKGLIARSEHFACKSHPAIWSITEKGKEILDDRSV